ncbi:MAG TPA: hypothetical protein VFF27_00155 [Bacteroidia bacterium]|jgi:hypothetical protein|nr:hypothetical protein [Bacteroidia bacterium]
MVAIQIENGQYLDLQKEFVGLNYQIADIGAIDTRTGTFTNDFNLPNTAHNRSALGFASVDNVIGDYNPQHKIPAKCFQNNIMIANGFLQVNGGDSKEIDITFYGDNVDVFELIRGKKLRECNLSHLRHAYNATNVINSFNNTSGYIYPVIDYGLFTDSVSMSIASGEIYTAVFVPDVLTAIFKDIGFKIDGTMLNRALYKKSVVPFVNNFFGYSKDFVQEKMFYVDNGAGTFTIAAGLTVTHNFTRELDFFQGVTFGTDLFNLGADKYVADDDYQIRIWYQFDRRLFTNLNGSATIPTLYIKKNGVVIATSTLGVSSVQVTTTVTNLDYIEFAVKNNHSGTITFGATGRGDVSQQFVAGSVIYPETVLPDMDQVDFVKWVLFRFLGVISVDQFSKTVYFNQFNDIKNNPVDDWSSNVDVSKKVDTNYSKILSKYAKRNIASYTEDENDNYQTIYNADNDLQFGAGVFTLDNDFLEDEKTIFETPFSGTFLIESFNTDRLLIPYIPRHLPGSDEVNVAEPRVLTVYGRLDISQFSNNTSISIMGTPCTSIPFSYFYKGTYGFEVDDFKESLAFGVQNVFAPNDLGAFESDYLSLIDILQNPNIKTAYLRLNQIDLSNLDFLKKKYIERFGGYFYLNIIEDYDGSGDSVKCVLVKV